LDALVDTIPSKQLAPVLIKSETAQPRCSAWHEKYLNLIEQSKPASYLVAHPIGGLSDSLTGLVTSFLLAYVSGRKFYLSDSSMLHQCAAFNFNVTVPDSPIFRNDKGILLDKKNSDMLLRKVMKSKERTIHVEGNRGAVYKIVTSAEKSGCSLPNKES
jgi:hypothetical protein